MEKYALELKDIYNEFETTTAVSNLSISIEQGEVVCLLGPSGCGKSTTLRLAAGLEKVQAGEVLLDGDLVSSVNFQVPPEQRDVGLVFQDYALFPHLSVIENAKFGLKKLTQEIAEGCALDALKMVNMDSYSQSYPHTLSGGEQQRVALARAMAPKPKIMLLDEPYSGLDARLRDNIRDEVLHLLKANECATLMVTHDSEEAMFMADRIVVMQEGKIIQTGKPEELYCNPVNAFVAGFFGELNFADGVVVEEGVDSDLGLLPSRDFNIGDEVEVVARPEALSIREGPCINEEKKAVVVESRLLGRSSLIHLSLPIHSKVGNKTKHLHARVPGVVLPRPGAIVGVELDLSQVFVFKK